MNIQKIIEDHNLSIRKLPMTRKAYKRIWHDRSTPLKAARLEFKFFEVPIKNAGCWLCSDYQTHTPTYYWSVKNKFHYPDPTLEGCLTKFILATYPDDEAKQAEYLCR
jgi:hypothetical protein